MSAPQRFLLLRGFVVPGVRLQNGGDRQRFIVLQRVLHQKAVHHHVASCTVRISYLRHLACCDSEQCADPNVL